MVSSAEILPYATAQDSRFRTARGAGGTIAMVLSIASLGFAVHQHGGEYTPVAITFVTFAIFAALIALVAAGKSKPGLSRIDHAIAAIVGLLFLAIFALWMFGGDQSAVHKIALGLSTFLLMGVIGLLMRYRADVTHRQPTWWVDYAFAAALALQIIALFTLWPVGVDQHIEFLGSKSHIIYLYLTGVCALLVLLGLINVASLRLWWFPALLLVYSILAFWTIRACPVPHIDVWYFQELGPEALLDGKNPYDYRQVNFADIYDSTLPGHQQVYGDGMVENGHLKFGFPYPPISLYCSTLGVIIGRDTRYAQALALVLAGLLIGYCRPGRLPKLAAALFLFTPTVWFVLGRAWTEPFVVLFLAATIFCAARNLRWLVPIAFGLFLASKQYLVFAVPLSFLLIPDFRWSSKKSWVSWIVLLFGAAIAGAIVTLPLALRDFHAFWFSLVTVQKDAPFRWDALSYLTWAGFNLDTKYTTWVWLAFAGAGLAMILSFWKARRSAAGFAAALALTYLLFIAFNKQAFCNYYFFVIGCIACAAASSPTAVSDESKA
ncbi:MAG TPA: hypothetical protein VFE47_05980 [Tepidisphaeraceae bacterium]|jgi:hypothetical protein|nr:hypothetical protein [Tepidisphaeraceae bacterium]